MKRKSDAVKVVGSFVTLQSDRKTKAVLMYMTSFTQTLPAGTQVGIAPECEEVQAIV